MMDEKRLSAPPVWIEENKYCNLGNASISIRVLNIDMRSTCATMELQSADGKKTMLYKVRKGESKFVNSKYNT